MKTFDKFKPTKFGFIFANGYSYNHGLTLES